jgi:putative flippase GtrA
MMLPRLKKSDAIAGAVAGEAIALLALVIFTNLALSLGKWRLVIPAALPILTVAGLWVALILSRFWATFWQVAKFLVTGVLNTLVDLGTLNLLIYLTGIASGIWYSVFKGAGFIAAATNSFFWNKFWVFEQREFSNAGKEFSKFISVSAVGIVLNVSIASVLVNVIGPPWGISEKLWGNAAAILAGIAVFIWNFLGYKLFVFRQPSPAESLTEKNKHGILQP